MELNRKPPVEWNYHNTPHLISRSQDIRLAQLRSCQSNSDSNYTLSSDTYHKESGCDSMENNPLGLNFQSIHGQTRLNNVANSLEKSEKLKKRNHTANNGFAVKDNSIANDSSVDKYTELLNKMKPSFDVLDKFEPLMYDYTPVDETKAKKIQTLPDLESKPKKSALVTNTARRPQLRKEKTVGFTDDVEVVEVENWKIYNVDMGKKQREEDRDKAGKICEIF